jgi:hypothetical protein
MTIQTRGKSAFLVTWVRVGEKLSNVIIRNYISTREEEGVITFLILNF